MTRRPMTYEVTRPIHPTAMDEWAVEAINRDGDGEIYQARFLGPFARQRAEEYAKWKNSGGGANLQAVAADLAVSS